MSIEGKSKPGGLPDLPYAAAFPLLYALGYRGCVYASRETIADTPRMIRKWMDYCRANGVELPYGEAHADAIRFVPLEQGENRVGHFRVLAGRSGHTAGSFWYALGWDRHAVWPFFYSRDMCLCSVTRAVGIEPSDIQLEHDEMTGSTIAFVITLKGSTPHSHHNILRVVRELKGVTYVEEL